MKPIIRQVEQDWDNDDDDDDWGEADLSLEQTRLLVYPDEVIRLNADGSAMLRIPLASIESVDTRLRPSLSAIHNVIACGVLFVIGRYASDSNWLSCLFYLFAMVFGLVAISGMMQRVLVLGRREQPLEIVVLESPDKVQGFVVSLREMLPKGHS